MDRYISASTGTQADGIMIFKDLLKFYYILSFVFSIFQVSTSRGRERQGTYLGWESWDPRGCPTEAGPELSQHSMSSQTRTKHEGMNREHRSPANPCVISGRLLTFEPQFPHL